jgi:hypothetical protein
MRDRVSSGTILPLIPRRPLVAQFAATDPIFLRRFDAETDDVAPDRKNANNDIRADNDFAGLHSSRQNKHLASP